MGQVFTEGRHTAEFLITEGNGTISREQGKLDASAAALEPGTVLGKVTATGDLIAYSNAASDGSQTAVGILYARATDLTVDQRVTYIARHAEVKASALTGLDATGTADLLTLGIVCR